MEGIMRMTQAKDTAIKIIEAMPDEEMDSIVIILQEALEHSKKRNDDKKAFFDLVGNIDIDEAVINELREASMV